MSEDPVRAATTQLASGGAIVLLDDGSAAPEGIVAGLATGVTAETVHFMASQAGGAVAVALLDARCDQLGLTELQGRLPSVERRPPFTQTIDAVAIAGSGASAADRALTIRTAADSRSAPGDLVTGGHVIALRARSGGVLVRAGLGEAGVDLARMAGASPAAVMVTILGERGEVAGAAELERFAERHGLPLVRISDVIAHRRRDEVLLDRVVTAVLPTRFGPFTAVGYHDVASGAHHMALVRGEVAGEAGVLVHVHVECLLGDVFHAGRCHCHDALDAALAAIAEVDRGIVVYLAHTDRGARLREWATVDGRERHESGGLALRERSVASQILENLGPASARVLTDDEPAGSLPGGYGIEVVETVPLTMVS